MCALKADFPQQRWSTWIIIARPALDSFNAGLGGSLEGESGQKQSDGSVKVCVVLGEELGSVPSAPHGSL